MGTIPTASEILDYIIKCGDLTKPISREVAIATIKTKCANEVDAALKAAAENAIARIHDGKFGSTSFIFVDKASVLTAYPPENIK